MLLLLLMALMVSKVELEVLLLMASSTSSLASSEELIKQILMIKVELASASSILPCLLPLNSLFTVLIIHLSLLGIGQCFIGISYLLKLSLCTLWVMFVLIGVILDG